jgi:potassium/hydrogen antiporter
MADHELILVAGLLLALGIGAALVADRVRVPGLVLFLALGMLVGSEGIGGVAFDDVELTRTVGTIALVLILFEGGLTAGWNQIRPIVGIALSLALLGTLATAIIAGLAAKWIIGLGTLEGLIVGSAIAATDSAAIFSVLRGSRLRRRLARTLEGESGMNDPVALLLVTGFISWIRQPDYGLADMAVTFAGELGIGAALGAGIGIAARWGFERLEFPTPGLYPVASIATAALSYGIAEVAHGSGFLAVYLTALAIGSGAIPARRTIVSFHQGLAWVSQISLFFLLGLLVLPSGLVDVAGKGLLLSAILMLVARPAAAFLATLFTRFSLAERVMVGWAGLRGAIPIWLATFPVIRGIEGSSEIFNLIFFVVATSTLVQGSTFEPLARRLRTTARGPALPQPLVETGSIQRLGGEVVAYRLGEEAEADGHMVKELGLPRSALLNVIVRAGEAIPPRGSTVVKAGDELHILVRRDDRGEVEQLTQRWEDGPVGEPEAPRLPIRGRPQVFSVRPWRESDGDPGSPEEISGIPILTRLRTRRDHPGALIALSDGRFAVTGDRHVAVGGRRLLAQWCGQRAERAAGDAQERAWWQEVAGVLSTPSPR